MEYKFTYFSNDGRGRGRVCSYFDPCPQWYAKGSSTRSEEMKDLAENWARFCNAYKVKKVFGRLPHYRLIGCRKSDLALQLERQLRCMVDHDLTIMDEDGKYYLVGSNYTNNGEMEKVYTKDSIPLGEYKGFKYEMKRTILPVEYSFYNIHTPARTFVWECAITPILGK